MKFYTKCMKIGQVTAEDRREFRIGEGIEHGAAARCASFLRARSAPLRPASGSLVRLRRHWVIMLRCHLL